MRKLIILMLCFVAMASTALGFQKVTYSNVHDDNILVRMLTERLGREGNRWAFQNGLTLDNRTNSAFEWNENSEELVWTFATNAINLSSSTGVVTMDFGSIVTKHDQILLDPVSTVVGTVEGTIYYDSDTNNFLGRNNSTFVDLGAAAAGNTLDGAYDSGGAGVGRSITADTGAVLITNTDADAAFLLDITPTPGSSAATGGIVITSGANCTQDSLQIVNAGSGDDIQAGNGDFVVSSSGELAAAETTITGTLTVSGGSSIPSLTLSSGEIIQNTVSTEIAFLSGSENFIFDMDAGTNAVGLKSTTGVDELQLGTVDDLTGVGSVTFDTGTSGTITQAGTVNVDITLSQSGSADNSLILSSTGTGADALQISTSAGGIDITVAGAASGEDLDLLSNRSITLTSSEDTVDAIKLNASAGGIDIDAVGEAGQDIIITNTGGSIQIVATENQANAIVLDASDAAGGFDIDAGTGGITVDITGAADFRVDSSAGKIILVGAEADGAAVTIDAENAAGGIDIDAGTGGIAVDITGAGDFRLDSSAGKVILVGAEAAATAITIDAENAAGGIDMDYGTGGMVLTGTGAAANLTIDVDALSFDFTDSSNITVTSSEGGEDLTISQIGGNDSSIIITAAGQGANAIELTTSDALGDIDINAGDAITVDAGDIVITTDDAVADQFKVDATGAVAGFAIVFKTTSGGIQLDADSAGDGDITIDAADVITLITGDSVIIDGGPLVPDIEFLSADGTNLQTFGASDFDTNAGAFTYALPDPALGLSAIGTTKVMTMSVAGNDADISVTNHVTSDPEVFRFNAVDEALVLIWTGTEWATFLNVGVDTP